MDKGNKIKDRSLGLKQFVTMAFLLVSVIPLLILGILFYQIFSTEYNQEIAEKNKLIGNTLQMNFDFFLNQNSYALHHLKDILSKIDLEDRILVDSILNSYYQIFPYFESIQLINSQGMIEHVWPLDPNLMQVDVSRKDYFQEVLEKEGLFWSQVYLSLSTESPVITVSLPWENGVIAGFIQLVELNDAIDAIELSNHGEVIITDIHGIVIAHPNRRRVLYRDNISSLTPISKGINGEAGTYEYTIDDVEYIGSVSLMESMGWIVLVHQSKEDLYSSQKQAMSLIFFIVTGQVILIMLLSLLSLNFAFSPLKALSGLIDEIYKGNYPEQAPQSIRFSEFRKVMDGFKKMSVAVKGREDELKSLRNYLNNIIHSMPSILIGVDLSGNVTIWNTEAEHQLGITAKKAHGKNISNLLPHFFKEDMAIESILGKKNVVNKKKIMKINGTERFLDSTFYPLTDSGTEGMVIRIDDRTDTHKMEQHLIQSQKMDSIGNLAGGLAHDFNNILTGVVTSTSMLKILLDEDPIDLGQIHFYIDTIDETGDRAIQLVKQLLTLSRRTELDAKLISMNSMIQKVLRICENSISKLVQIKTRIPEEEGIVYADQGQIEQVILNLCINASHAMTIMSPEDKPKGGELLISLNFLKVDKAFKILNPDAEEQEYVSVEVSDTGVGMTKEILDRIFEPFYSTKEKNEGTGLGLAMVYTIIKKHKGFVKVYSEPQKGSKFSIYLPRKVIDKDADFVRKESKALIKGSGTVLVIDDEAVIRKLADNILSDCGYTVLTAENGPRGLELFQKNKDIIAAIILDMNMPIMHGKDVYDSLKRIDEDIPILISSGLAYDSSLLSREGRSMSHFISKPFRAVDLSEKIHMLLHSEA